MDYSKRNGLLNTDFVIKLDIGYSKGQVIGQALIYYIRTKLLDMDWAIKRGLAYWIWTGLLITDWFI